MNYVRSLLPVVLLFMVAQGSLAQRRWNPDDPERPIPGRLQKFWKMRVVEVLKLSEDDAVRFSAKQSAHDDTNREFFKARSDAVNELENLIKDNGDAGKINATVDRITDLDRKIFDERRRYHEELRKFLTTEQYAKLLVFERNFSRQVRSALEEMHQERRDRGPD